MGLFEDIGREFEKTKRAVSERAGGDPTHRCTACDELVDEDYDFCPHCGEAAVEPRE